MTLTDDSHALNPPVGSPSDPRPLGPDDSPQMASLPDESRSSSSWAPTDTHSGQTESWSPHRYVSPPSSSWAPTDTHSGQTKSWSPHRYVSPATTPGQLQDHVPFPPNLGDRLPLDSNSMSSTAGYYLGSSDEQSTAGYYLGSQDDDSSTADFRPPIPGPTGNHPPPASSSNPGPSTERNPRPSAKRPRPEEDDFRSFLSKIPKGKLKRRFSGFDAVR